MLISILYVMDMPEQNVAIQGSSFLGHIIIHLPAKPLNVSTGVSSSSRAASF